MLSPRKVKYRKIQKGRVRRKSCKANKPDFGKFALKAVECGWITDRQIEAARIAMTRFVIATSIVGCLIGFGFSSDVLGQQFTLRSKLGGSFGAIAYHEPYVVVREGTGLSLFDASPDDEFVRVSHLEFNDYCYDLLIHQNRPQS